MRRYVAFVTLIAVSAAASAGTEEINSGSSLITLDQGELLIEIHPPPKELPFVGEPVTVDIEGVTSAIGGVRYLDIMLVMDTSMSLRKSDPDNYRSAGAIGLVENLSPKSDTQLGVVSFDDGSELIQPLTPDRAVVAQSLQDLKRSGGTNIAAGNPHGACRTCAKQSARFIPRDLAIYRWHVEPTESLGSHRRIEGPGCHDSNAAVG